MTNDIPKGAPGHRPGEKLPVGKASLNPGMLVFFNSCKTSTKRGVPVFGIRGHGFGILLGVTPLFAPEPNRKQVTALMGNIGFVLLDDVAEFLGDEQARIFVEKFQAKYDEAPPEEKKILTPDQPTLVDAKGQPLEAAQETINLQDDLSIDGEKC